jgi:hypothetical protein
MNKVTGWTAASKKVKVSTLPIGTLVCWEGTSMPESVYVVGNNVAVCLKGTGYISRDALVTVIPRGTVLTITVGGGDDGNE